MMWKSKECDSKGKGEKKSKEDKIHSDHLSLRGGRDTGTCLVVVPVPHSHFVLMFLPQAAKQATHKPQSSEL